MPVREESTDIPNREPRSDARRNRSAVVEAAVAILSEDRNASMQAIAEASGLGRTTVYRHFSSREELISALFAMLIEESRQATNDLVRNSASAESLFSELGGVLIRVTQRYLFLDNLAPSGEEAIRASATPADPLVDFIIEAQGRGEVRGEVSARWIQISIMQLAKGAVQEQIAGVLSQEEAGKLLGDTLVRAFVSHTNGNGSRPAAAH